MESETRLKRWMMCIGLAGLATGIAIGICIPAAFGSERPVDDPWLAKATRDYHLRPRQVGNIREVLIQRRLDISEIKTSIPNDQLDPAYRQRVEAARRKADDRIRGVLDENQRAEYSKHLNERESSRSPGNPDSNERK